MRRTGITFPCGDILLEGMWHLSETSSSPAVIVCHPHPIYGGDMSNNIVTAICQELPQHSIAAFRFNFRGAGNSGGSFGGGVAEQEDIKAAINLILSTPEIDAKKIGLAGYSFGASVALPVALQDERVSLLALVSPALAESGWEQLMEYHKSKFLIVGDADYFIPPERFQEHIKGIAPEQYQMVSGADHFWLGYEGQVAQSVAQFFVSGFSRYNPV